MSGAEKTPPANTEKGKEAPPKSKPDKSPFPKPGMRMFQGSQDPDRKGRPRT